MEDPNPIENIDRLGDLMFQTSDNSQLQRRVLWINGQLTIFWSLKHKISQPIYIFNRENSQNSEFPEFRITKWSKEGTWFHSFESYAAKKKWLDLLLEKILYSFYGIQCLNRWISEWSRCWFSLCLPGAKSGLIKERGFLLLVLFSFPVGRQHYVINTIAQVKYNIYESCGEPKST